MLSSLYVIYYIYAMRDKDKDKDEDEDEKWEKEEKEKCAKWFLHLLSPRSKRIVFF